MKGFQGRSQRAGGSSTSSPVTKYTGASRSGRDWRNSMVASARTTTRHVPPRVSSTLTSSADTVVSRATGVPRPLVLIGSST